MFSRGGRRAPGLAPPSPFPQGAGLGETYRAQSLSLSSRLWIYLPTGSANNLRLRQSIFTKLCLGAGQRSARRPLTLAKLPHQAFISSKANISISATGRGAGAVGCCLWVRGEHIGRVSS